MSAELEVLRHRAPVVDTWIYLKSIDSLLSSSAGDGSLLVFGFSFSRRILNSSPFDSLIYVPGGS